MSAHEEFHEVVPATLVSPMLPELDRTALSRPSLRDVPVESWRSRPTQIETATRNRVEAIDQFIARSQRGDRSAFRELLDIARQFQYCPRFAEAMADSFLADEFERTGIQRRRGRSREATEDMLLIGRIGEALRMGGCQPGEILEAMNKWKIGSMGDLRRRQLFYQAPHHPGLKPHFFTREDQRRFIRGPLPGPRRDTFCVTGFSIAVPVPLPSGTRFRVCIEAENARFLAEATVQ
jgi:hypothetical protein